MIRIAEIFHSVQGEGRLTGTQSVFVRTSGCNLRCWFCDTMYASWEPEGDSVPMEDIVDSVLKWPSEHVVITGGEPMIYDEIADLVERLQAQSRHVTIETAGTIARDMPCDLWSISPKLSNSTPIGYASNEWVQNHDDRRNRPDIVAQLMRQGDYQLKFVVGSILDAVEAEEYLTKLSGWDRSKVLMMPRGTTSEDLDLQRTWLMPWCQKHGYHYCDRQHIYWYGNTRGT